MDLYQMAFLGLAVGAGIATSFLIEKFYISPKSRKEEVRIDKKYREALEQIG